MLYAFLVFSSISTFYMAWQIEHQDFKENFIKMVLYANSFFAVSFWLQKVVEYIQLCLKS